MIMNATIQEGINMDVLEQKWQQKRKWGEKREAQLFAALQTANPPLNEEEERLLKHLFAYMPIHDLANCDGEFFVKHVRDSLKVREAAPWGSKIPDYIFVNFVLPYRVNNENVDNSREVIREELMGRVKHLSMKEAILEANYWCHEKATYIGTDMRTVSPLTIMRTALGRCGEQSTLAVAALRSVGIPARQCYTPRWAHSDSNHAWVEAWADGEWYFFGACEPEPVLNEGWFRAPSTRAMLVNTRVGADYTGPEEVCSDHPWWAEINLLDNYANTKKITVKVVDEAGKPVANAIVGFQVYNYAEFYPIVEKKTEANGEVSLTTGLGDILLHVRNEQGWGFSKVSVADADTFELVLYRNPELPSEVDWDMAAPAGHNSDSEVQVSDEAREKHEARVKEGVQIRTGFEAAFWNEEKSAELAKELQLPTDRVAKVLITAKGNGDEIAQFLKENKAHGEWPLRLLEAIREKDLHDTFRDSLNDHLAGALKHTQYQDNKELFDAYILNPRVYFEMIAPYRAFFQETVAAADQAKYQDNPAALVAMLQNEIEIVEKVDRYAGMGMPAGTYQLRITDKLSRDICFVAMARSFGIPARLEPFNLNAQYWHEGQWHDAAFERAAQKHEEVFSKGTLFFDKVEQDSDQVAAYNQNFSVARLEAGQFRTLTIPFGEKDVYDRPFEVLTGQYRLTTGTRLSSGDVLVRCSFFTVEAGQEAHAPLVFRAEQIEVPVLGELAQADLSVFPGADKAITIPASGAVFAWLDPEREPTKHLLRELRELKIELDSWGGDIHLLVGDDKIMGELDTKGLPSGAHYTMDIGNAFSKQIQSTLTDIRGIELPLVVVADQAGQVRYIYEGYKLGIGADILKTVMNMK